MFKLAFVWIGILVAVISLRRGKWIPSIGAFVKLALVGFVSLTVVIYAFSLGVHGYGIGSFSPTLVGFLGAVPVLLFASAALSTWVALFPGVLERLFGLSYDFSGTWGVSRGRFEALTLGTVAVIIVLTLTACGWAHRSAAARPALSVRPATSTSAGPEP